MKLVDRISQQNSTAPAGFQRSLIGGGAKKKVKDSQAEGFQALKLAVHNRLFETLDVTRLESLEPALASQKVTEAITAILEDEGRLLTDTDRFHLIEEIKNELLGLGPLEPLLWADELTKRRRWSMRACRTALVSMRSYPRWRWTGPRSRFVVSDASATTSRI